ncbi:hypothetical protein CT310_004082 [Shigella flexneri]|nr:hypothetical protein [Shigella flexneri]
MLPSETMIWQPEFTDKTLSRKPGAVHINLKLMLQNGMKVKRVFSVVSMKNKEQKQISIIMD